MQYRCTVDCTRKRLLECIEVPESIQERDISSLVKVFLNTSRIANMPSRNRQFKTESHSPKKILLVTRRSKHHNLCIERTATLKRNYTETPKLEPRKLKSKLPPHSNILKSLQYLKKIALKSETDSYFEEVDRLLQSRATSKSSNYKSDGNSSGFDMQVDSLSIIRKIREYEKNKEQLNIWQRSKDCKKRLSFHVSSCAKVSRNKAKRKLTESEPFELAMERLAFGPLELW